MALNSYKEERKNMSYTALYRKFRPDAFSDVKGQDHIVTTLKNQLRANRIGHAYLFTGTRGTGKTTVAKIFAKTVNCEHPTEDGPCGECRICKAIAAGASMNVIEIDAASNNGVDNIREIIDEVSYSPAEGKYKVYIIDEVHMLSRDAFNALLKIMEEPPAHLLFILATTESQKVPATILSRCQRFNFKRILPHDMEQQLLKVAKAEAIDLTPDGADLLARMANGALRDALSLLDQCRAAGAVVDGRSVLDTLGLAGSTQTVQLMRLLLARQGGDALALLDQLYRGGKDVGALLGELSDLCRDMTVLAAAPEGGGPPGGGRGGAAPPPGPHDAAEREADGAQHGRGSSGVFAGRSHGQRRGGSEGEPHGEEQAEKQSLVDPEPASEA